MQYTDKLNLSKPDGSDYVEVQVLSENFQKIDDAIENDLTATEQGHILDARQGKVLDDNMVHNTGNEKVGGVKYFTNEIWESKGRYKTIRFVHGENSDGTAAQTSCAIEADAGNATNQTSNRISFYQYSPKSTAATTNTGYYERFRLPVPTKGLASNASYDVLTSKVVADDRINVLGSAVQKSDSKSVANNSITELCSETITRTGNYIIIAFADWANNANGQRRLFWNTNSGLNPDRDICVSCLPVSGEQTYQQLVCFKRYNSNTTVKLYGYQNSGSSLNCWCGFKAVYVGE